MFRVSDKVCINRKVSVYASILNLLTRKSRCPPCTVSSIDYDDIVFVTKNDGTTRGIPRITRDVYRTIQQIHRAELYVIKVWSRMLSAVFDDSSKRTFSMWGDSVPKESSKYKALVAHASNSIGDKINLRVCHLSPGSEVVDLLCVKFAKDANDDKYYQDHRKALRKAKINEDRFYRDEHMKSRKKENHFGVLYASSRYRGKHQSCSSCGQRFVCCKPCWLVKITILWNRFEKKTRILLFTIKNDLVKQEQQFDSMEQEKAALKKSMEAKRKDKRSPYENEFDRNSSDSCLSSLKEKLWLGSSVMVSSSR